MADFIPEPRRPLAVAGLMLGLFLASLDNTITGAAMPKIIKDFGGFEHYHFVFIAYILMTSVTTPLWGRLADLYGRRRFFIAGVLIFMAGSAWAGAVNSMTGLIFARGLQGLGAGGVLTLAFTMMAGLFPPERRGASLGFLSAVWTLSSIVGPQVGGWLAETGHWRWCFYVNLPSGAVALLLIWVSDVSQPSSGAKRTPDFLGAFLLLIASLSLFAGLSRGREGWLSPAVLGSFAAAALFSGLLAWRQARVADPFIAWPLFRNPTFARVAAIGFFAVIAMFCGISFLPLFGYTVLGESLTEAATILTALGITWSGCAMAAGLLSRRLGYRVFVGTGGVLMAIAFLLLVRLGPGSSWWALAGAAALLGAGLGGVISITTIAAQNSVEAASLGSATSLVQFCRNIGAMIGLSTLGSLLMSVLLSKGVPPSDASALLDPEMIKTMPNELIAGYRGALTSGLHSVFWADFVVSLIAAAIGFTLPSPARPAASTSGAPAPRSPG